MAAVGEPLDDGGAKIKEGRSRDALAALSAAFRCALRPTR
jgi:hypothetical protein